jgi:hypothetical protein
MKRAPSGPAHFETPIEGGPDPEFPAEPAFGRAFKERGGLVNLILGIIEGSEHYARGGKGDRFRTGAGGRKGPGGHVFAEPLAGGGVEPIVVERSEVNTTVPTNSTSVNDNNNGNTNASKSPLLSWNTSG